MNEERKEEQSGNEEGGVAFREICRIIGKKIWYVLAGTVLVTLAAVLIFMFAINPAKQHKSMSFRINYPMSTEGKYPDGSMFDYRAIVSRSVIESAKNNSEYKDEFASVDVNKVIKKEGVTISAERISDDSDAPYIYTVSLKNAYFGGVNAEHFIEALTESFKSFVVDKADNLSYKLDPDTYNRASYKDKLSLLDERKEVLLKQYESWIKEYSAGHKVDGKSLGDRSNQVMTTFADDVRTPIENDLKLKGYEYFNDDVDSDKVDARVEELRNEQKRIDAILNKLKEGNTASAYASSFASAKKSDPDNSDGNTIIIMPSEAQPDLSQMIAEYSERSAVIAQQIANLTEKDNDEIVEDIKKFGARLAAQFEALNAEAGILENVIRTIYGRDTLLSLESQKATSEGGTSIVIVAVAVFVVAFLIFAVVAYFAGKKNIKSKKSGSAPKEENEKNE